METRFFSFLFLCFVFLLPTTLFAWHDSLKIYPFGEVVGNYNEFGDIWAGSVGVWYFDSNGVFNFAPDNSGVYVNLPVDTMTSTGITWGYDFFSDCVEGDEPTYGYVRPWVGTTHAHAHVSIRCEDDAIEIGKYNLSGEPYIQNVSVGVWHSLEIYQASGTTTLAISLDGANYVYGVSPYVPENNQNRFNLEQSTDTENEYKLRNVWVNDNVYNDGGFELDYYFSSIDETHSVQDVGCHNTANITSCAFATSTYAIAVNATTTSNLVAPWKYEFQMTYLDGTYIDPSAGGSGFGRTTSMSIVGTAVFSDPIVFPDKDKRIYKLGVCDAPPDLFPLVFGYTFEVLCYTSYIGNGYDDDELFTTLVGMGVFSSTTQATGDSAWLDNGCNDLGLTDVFPAIKCAFIWAFYPDMTMIKTKLHTMSSNFALIPPWGYVTLIHDKLLYATTSVDALSTSFNVSALTGVGVSATSTVDWSHMASSSIAVAVRPLEDVVRPFLWFGAWVLLISFALRKVGSL